MTIQQRTLWVFISLASVLNVSILVAQNDEGQRSYDLADSLVKAAFGPTFDVGSVLDVDLALAKPRKESQWLGYIFQDPGHQFQHCLLVSYGKWDSLPPEFRFGSGEELNDSGAIAIVRSNMIVWYSKRFLLDYSDVGGRISGFADLNNDGITDIVFSVSRGGRGSREFLWLVSPTPGGGRLINKVDDDGRSVIIGADDTFEIADSRRSKFKDIRAIDPDLPGLQEILYEWNGSVFTRSRPKPSQKRN